MLSGNMRRDSGTRARPEVGEESCAAAPEPEPPELGLPPEGAELPGPELVMTPPDWPLPPERRSRALRIASSSSTSRTGPEPRPPESAGDCPILPGPMETPAPPPAVTPEPPEVAPPEPATAAPTTPEPLPPAGFPPLLPRASGSLRPRPGPGSSGGRMVAGPWPTSTGSRRPVGGGGLGTTCPAGGLWTATTGDQRFQCLPGRQHQPCPPM